VATSRIEPPGDTSSAPESLGKRLRALRQSRRLSLGDVAQATQISASFLSLVENGRSDITIGRLTRLVEFYDISITDLVPDPGGDDPDVVRRKDARLLHSPDEGIDVYLLVGDTDRTMMPMLLEFEPGAALAEYGRHPGEEFVHVLSGTLSLEVEGDEPRELKAGDSAYYPGDRPHLFGNASATKRLRLICIDSPPPL
jgi:XRE family transcriptional regulator, regulator of sulfur utilization